MSPRILFILWFILYEYFIGVPTSFILLGSLLGAWLITKGVSWLTGNLSSQTFS